MRFFGSPLTLLGMLVSIAALILLILLSTRGFLPAGTLLITIVAGLLMILVDHFLIRRTTWNSRQKLLIQTLITISIIVLFLLTFRVE